MMMTLSELILFIRKYVNNPAISDESLLNSLIQPLVFAGSIKDKNREEYHLNKARTSEIINRKADVPAKLRDAMTRYGIEEKVSAEMNTFIEDVLGKNNVACFIHHLITIAESDSSISDEEKDVLAQKKDDPNIILTKVLFMALGVNNFVKPETITIWKRGANSVDVLFGDIFHYGFDNRHTRKNIIVIPVNTAFDTHISRKIETENYPLVSENTIHGKWLKRMYQIGERIDKLDFRIEDSLFRLGFPPAKDALSSNGKKKCYQIGSVAAIEANNAVYYLLAIAEFDTANNAHSTPEKISSALKSLLNIYDIYGQGYDLFLPLIGTGRSRVGLSAQASFDLLTNCIISNRSMINGSIHIVLRPEEKRNITIREEY